MKASLIRFCYVLAVLAVASYAFVTLRGPRGAQALFEKEAAILEMEKVNTKLTREIEQMRDHIRRLSEDPEVQEQIIREQLKLVHPDERVFITGPPAGPRSTPGNLSPSRQGAK
ncbi:MAG: FtsB family cell division protein [Bryobacteraceae bacterium]